MSDWKVIAPVATTNRVLNPSFETTGNFAAEAGTTVTRVTTFQHYGLYSARVETNANNEGIEITLSALANAIHYVTVRVRGTLPTTWDWSLDDTNFTSPTLLETIDGDWKLYGLQFVAAQANGSTKLSIHQNGTGSGDFYLDGIQVEEQTTWTTYCDGTQSGCEWTGTPHGSASSRSANSRAGGFVRDLEDDYGFRIGGMSGTGTAPQELFIDSYAQLPGGEFNSRKTNSRVITLTGVISEDTEAEFYATKQALESLFDPETYPEDEDGEQPVRLRFNGATVHKEISVHYETGLEANITADDPCAWEQVAVRFIADDPYWYEIGESAALLDTNDTATFRVVAARLRSTGQWEELGPPNAAGTYTSVLALAEDDTYIYIGGNFLNFDNIANADYIVRYNKATGVYSAMAPLNASVQAIVIAPNGDVIVGGEFTNASGVAAADYIAVWAVGASAFTALGIPVTGAASITAVMDMAFDGSGNLIIGGIFDNWADIANADNVVMWTGSAYSALSTGCNSQVRAVEYRNGLVYLGGNFSSPYDAITYWDGSSFHDMGGGIFGALVETITSTPAGIVYIGGVFTTIYRWDGAALTDLQAANNDSAYSMAIGADGVLWVGGIFTTIGGVALNDRVASYNGYVWSHLDIDLPGSPTVFSVMASNRADPVVPQKYDLYLGFSTTGTGAFAGKVTASNGGTAPAFPKIIYTRSGGTGATIQTLKNELTGEEILFNYSLLDGETLTIDLASPKKEIASNFFGPRQDAALAGLDDWALLMGSNSITSFVSESGSPTVVGYMLWKDAFKSQN